MKSVLSQINELEWAIHADLYGIKPIYNEPDPYYQQIREDMIIQSREEIKRLEKKLAGKK